MNIETSVFEAFKRPSGFVPIGMSLAAFGVIGIHIAAVGFAPQQDEGMAAHIWQLLMVAQIPIIAFFVVKWVRRAPRRALPVLGAQVAAALLAIAPVAFLHW